MKKLIYTLFLAAFLMISVHSSISSGVKVISKCCKDLSFSNSKANCPYSEDEKTKASEYSNSSSLLPVNSWDAKMLIW